ncbi:hypothetical protein [Streptomyces sp. NBC_00572]|uniref:hypothetical protein n=1 Tax=Streptomyces sp. NBC_00572 TaxID=2903664 RepID=UPI00225BB915|nr:hypothetical protein [Streptomyces sp. NBC_00572]MCX4986515.1 hypothetical protein [Streptomyces sp. NBC_00572]
MEGSLVFVHGTGVREGVKDTLEKVRTGMEGLGLPRESVSAPHWGEKVGPADLDVTPILPESSVSTRAAMEVEAPESGESEAATWGLLIEDPLIELRIRAAARPGPADVVLGVVPLQVEVQQRMDGAAVPQGALKAAGVTDEELRSAITSVRDSDVLIGIVRAMDRARNKDEPVDANEQKLLLDAVSRSVVAFILRGHRIAVPPKLSPIAISGDERTQFVDAVSDTLSGAPTRGVVTQSLWKVLGPLAVRIGNAKAKEHRAKLMDPFSDFIRDVAFYIRRGEAVREVLATAISDLPPNGPVVVVGHSLGGIAMVDLLSGDDAPHVDLLVTAGSQAPYLYLLDALVSLEPGKNAKPFTPWLNIYSPADFLSFRAAPAFDGVSGIVDRDVDAGVPFPESHSAYWAHAATYALIKDNWP